MIIKEAAGHTYAKQNTTKKMQLAPWMLLLIVGLALAQRDACPDEETLRPCTCDGTGINCMHVQTTAQLEASFTATGQNEHEGLWIQKTPLRHINSGVFGMFKFAEVYIEMNANLTSFVLECLGESQSALRVLSLFSNAIDRFSFEKVAEYPELRTLNLARNMLTSIPPRAFRAEQLETLALSHNPITSVGRHAFSELPGLKKLLLQNTRLSTLGPYSFAWRVHSVDLTILLEKSRISDIHESAFEGTGPITLNLARNNLTSLAPDVFLPLAQSMINNMRNRMDNELAVLFTGGNPLSCRGCDYLWLVRNKRNPVLRQILRDFRCSDGSRLYELGLPMIRCNVDGRNRIN